MYRRVEQNRRVSLLEWVQMRELALRLGVAPRKCR
jgi:hypothetical protein